MPETYNFWDLHVAIQDAMGWMDSHLHIFLFNPVSSHKDVEIGIPYKDMYEDEIEILPGWEIPVIRYFNELGVVSDYNYDFGDCWNHEVLFEGKQLREKGKRYPKCIGGERACPPEDCGGIPGYYNLLEIISDPDNEAYKSMITWLGKKYDPAEFDPRRVKFDNPKRRWETAFKS